MVLQINGLQVEKVGSRIALVSHAVLRVSPQEFIRFLNAINPAKDIFVHVSALERAGLTELADGQKVTFDRNERHQHAPRAG